MNQNHEIGIMLFFQSPCGQYELVIEYDGKVAYGYLKKSGQIIGDVWLYNRCSAPLEPEWNDKSNIPFANPIKYTSKEGRLQTDVKAHNIRVTWKYDNEKPAAYIFIYEDLFGVVGPGDRPGYARFAIKDGPLAKVLQTENHS